MENESHIIEQSKYYEKMHCKDLSINVLISINAKFDHLKLFLDDVNIVNPLSVICIQES